MTANNGVQSQPRSKPSATELQRAAIADNLNNLVACLEKGCDPNERDRFGWTALHFAAQTNSTLCIQALADFGADLNAQNRAGVTALHVSAESDCVGAAIALIEKGAWMEIKNDSGHTPLRLAVRLGSFLTHVLMAYGADKSVLTPASDFPEFSDLPMLHAAARCGLTKRAVQLMRQGHDPDVERHRLTALEEAIKAGFQETAAAIQAHKAGDAIDQALRLSASGASSAGHSKPPPRIGVIRAALVRR